MVMVLCLQMGVHLSMEMTPASVMVKCSCLSNADCGSRVDCRLPSERPGGGWWLMNLTSSTEVLLFPGRKLDSLVNQVNQSGVK